MRNGGLKDCDGLCRYCFPNHPLSLFPRRRAGAASLCSIVEPVLCCKAPHKLNLADKLTTPTPVLWRSAIPDSFESLADYTNDHL